VDFLVDRLRGRRRVERRPAATRVVLRLRHEQLGAAARTVVLAGLEGVVVLAGERRLRPLLAQDAVLLGCQLRTPLLVGLLDFRHQSPLFGSSLQSCWRAIHYASEGWRAGPPPPMP